MFGFGSKRSARGAKRRATRAYRNSRKRAYKKASGLTGKQARKVRTARKRYKSGKGIW